MGRREARNQETRDRLLAAAGTCFDRKGYDATTLDEILGEAGLARGTLYYHFDSKEALAAALSRRALAEATREALGRMKGGDPLRRVRTVLRASASWVERHPRLAQAFYGRIREEGHRAGAGELRETSLRAILGDLLAEAQEAGQVRADLPAALLGQLLAHLYFKAVLAWLAEPGGRRLEPWVGLHLRIFLEGAGA